MFVINFTIYIIAFILIWLGSGLIISSTSKFTERLRLSPFAFSFVALGLLTSTPEFSVGLQAVASHDAEIFVGNLLGGITVLFLVVIPLLAIFGNGISLKHELDHRTLLATLFVILAPSIFVLDKKVTNLEGLIMIILYLFLLFLIERKNGIFDRKNSALFNIKSYSYKDVLKILLGVVIVFITSSIIVGKTMYFAQLLGIPAFYIGLIVIALGTDLPELSLGIRSVITGKKDIAMGDYIGAAAASTFLFGILTILHNGEVITISNFLVTFLFISTALCLFYFLAMTKNYISRNNGFILFGTYIIFLILEFVT